MDGIRLDHPHLEVLRGNDDAHAMAVRIVTPGKQGHHVEGTSGRRITDRGRSPRRSFAPSPVEKKRQGACLDAAYFTSFQYSFFSAKASSVKKIRNAMTGKPSEVRLSWAGSPM